MLNYMQVGPRTCRYDEEIGSAPPTISVVGLHDTSEGGTQQLGEGENRNLEKD